VNNKKPDGGGIIWPGMFNCIIAALIIVQLIMLAVFASYLFFEAVPFCIILVIVSFAFIYKMHAKYKQIGLYSVLDSFPPSKASFPLTGHYVAPWFKRMTDVPEDQGKETKPKLEKDSQSSSSDMEHMTYLSSKKKKKLDNKSPNIQTPRSDDTLTLQHEDDSATMSMSGRRPKAVFKEQIMPDAYDSDTSEFERKT